jgi:peroxin-16
MERLRLSTRRIPEALSLPPKWLNMYDDFIIKNASSVSQIESALRSLTYIIPGMTARWSVLAEFVVTDWMHRSFSRC